MRAICVDHMGYSRTKALVPSMGSTIHRYSASRRCNPVSSPKKPWEGKRLSMISRIANSQRTSASVTGDLSALMRTSILRWYKLRAMAAACSAASSAAWSSGEWFIERHHTKPCARVAHPRRLKIMGNRLSKIYTRTGDDGSTGLGDGTRVAKENLRVEAYGTVDETNSALGVVL